MRGEVVAKEADKLGPLFGLKDASGARKAHNLHRISLPDKVKTSLAYQGPQPDNSKPRLKEQIRAGLGQETQPRQPSQSIGERDTYNRVQGKAVEVHSLTFGQVIIPAAWLRAASSNTPGMSSLAWPLMASAPPMRENQLEKSDRAGLRSRLLGPVPAAACIPYMLHFNHRRHQLIHGYGAVRAKDVCSATGN
eukprot:scaffold297386_cov33-Prasinocladus_malaysianus.AAC.1